MPIWIRPRPTHLLQLSVIPCFPWHLDLRQCSVFGSQTWKHNWNNWSGCFTAPVLPLSTPYWRTIGSVDGGCIPPYWRTVGSLDVGHISPYWRTLGVPPSEETLAQQMGVWTWTGDDVLELSHFVPVLQMFQNGVKQRWSKFDRP